MTRPDPKMVALSFAALIVAITLGFTLSRYMPIGQDAPLAVVTVDRVAEAAARDARAERDELAARFETVTAERDKAQKELEAQRAEWVRETENNAGPSQTQLGLQSQLVEMTAERDVLVEQMAALRARVEDQAVALEAATAEAESLKRALIAAETEVARQSSRAGDTDRQQAQQPQQLAAAPDSVDGGLSDTEIEAAVEDGLKAYQAKDFNTAFLTWQPLADQGVARAQFYIGALYRDGAGVDRDVVKAYVWLKRSDESGYIYAKGLLDRVSKEMTPDQMAAAEAILRQR